MSMIRNFVDADVVCRAWIEAGRPFDFNRFAREYQAAHAAGAPAKPAPRIELWIRRKATRRQAYWREAGSEAGWDWVEITKADRAEREGRISVGSFVDAEVVMHEEQVTQ